MKYGSRIRLDASKISRPNTSFWRPVHGPIIPASHGSRFLNSDDLIARVDPPTHLFIIGGGYVGCEFASIYRALGCRVTLAEQREQLLPDWDTSVGERVTAELSAKGVELDLGRKVEVEKVPIEDGYPIITQPDGDEISPDLVLVATGRRPNVESIGLESLGIETNPLCRGGRAIEDQAVTYFRNWRCKRVEHVG